MIKSEKLNSLAVLSAGMAHELNNPLGAINFNLEVLKLHYLRWVLFELIWRRKSLLVNVDLFILVSLIGSSA